MMSISRISTESTQPPGIARDRADEQPDREADGDRDDPDQKRIASAVHDPREQVAAERVDSEEVLGGRPRAAAPVEKREILMERVVGGDQRREERDEDERPHHEEPDDGTVVVAQPPPGLRPEAARRTLEPDFSGFDFGDTHETRIRGLTRAYVTSTARLTRTKMTETNRIPPCRTA